MSEAAFPSGGFAEPVFEAQAAFRALMAAMAEPGTVQMIETAVRPPEPMSPVAGAVLSTLCDADTPVWLDTALAANEAAGQWIAFHAGAPVTANPIEAHFAFVTDPSAMPALGSFSLGSQEYPDRSTTIVLQVSGFEDGDPITLAGPGIRATAALAPFPMPRNFAAQWNANGRHFPRGIDLVLAGPGAVACMPRTVRLAGREA